MLADDQGLILNRKAVELLLRKAANSRSLGDVGGLPKEWSSFTRNDFEKLVRNLDINNSGSIDHRVLATSCILLKSDLPTDKDIDAMKRSLQQLEVTEDQFLAGEFWFEKSENSTDRGYSIEFPR